jgi:hypothetical protein
MRQLEKVWGEMTELISETIGRMSDSNEAGAGLRSVVLTAEAWKPFYCKGDALFLDEDVKVSVHDHAMVTTMDDRVYLGAVTRHADDEISLMCFSEFQERITIPKNEITTLAKIACTIKA